MKKIITTFSAVGLSFQSGSTNTQDDIIETVTSDDMKLVYANEASFKGSGFFDLSVEKTVILSGDNDQSGDVTLGDELTYTVKVINLEGVDAENVQLFDLLDSKIELSLGTVAVTQGMVISGNGFFDPDGFIDVEFGNITANWFALANFEVTVTSLQPGLNVINNSAEVYGPDNSFFISDDPTTPLFDPTQIDAYGAFPDLIYADGFEFRGSGGF